ncbi:hypothetical protein [Chondromyces apiculatus]|uniref:HEAT repeat domain-containing protein n=1 Tax=Chondromyces apiculatus DSM 436 TaxID=1192034 RepID=A0A017TBT5_9BACT|nr:hypothetical protein [Chondromyces apiculatus]EYF06753.1 Hypothetical protein CAP_1450 [Chondromyces apiculatus DSM 436]
MASRRKGEPRASSFDDKLARIRALEGEPAVTATAELRRYLGEANGFLSGEAAKVAAAMELSSLAPDVAEALLRLLRAGTEADKGCFGKRQLVEALMAFDASTPEALLVGLRHVQKEPAYGGPIDTAATLRGLCAHALVQMHFRWAELEVAPLLMDPEPETRTAAAEALAASGETSWAAALHVKVLAGDAEPEVLGACYRGLLALDARRYLPLVAKVLGEGEAGGAGAESAAIALGESRLPEALEVLKEALGKGSRGKGGGSGRGEGRGQGEGRGRGEESGRGGANLRLVESVLLGVALLRSEEANAFLVTQVAEAHEAHAVAAVAALAMHRHDARLMVQVREVAEQRGSRRLREAVEEKL